MFEEKRIATDISILEMLTDKTTFIKNLKIENSKLYFTIYYPRHDKNLNLSLNLINCNESALKEEVDKINKREKNMLDSIEPTATKTICIGVLLSSIAGAFLGYMNPELSVLIFLSTCSAGIIGSILTTPILFMKEFNQIKENKCQVIELVTTNNLQNELESVLTNFENFIIDSTSSMLVKDIKAKQIKKITNESRVRLLEFKQKIEIIKSQNENYNYKTNKNLIRSKSILSK